jgi:hypothetical protein
VLQQLARAPSNICSIKSSPTCRQACLRVRGSAGRGSARRDGRRHGRCRRRFVDRIPPAATASGM